MNNNKTARLGIIGGSGANEVIRALGVKARHFGEPYVLEVPEGYTFDHKGQHGTTQVVFYMRHGTGRHGMKDPARLGVAQQAMLLDAKKRGLDFLIIMSATGSLDTKIRLIDEGGFVVNSDIMRGFGYKGTSYSLHPNPFAVLENPFNDDARALVFAALHALNPQATAYDGGTYVINEGNSFESRTEIADLVSRLSASKTQEVLLHLSDVVSDLADTMGQRIRDKTRAKLRKIQGILEALPVPSPLLNLKYAQVGMNAGREIINARELGSTGFEARLALVSLPVNYGVGLVHDVSHERTLNALRTAADTYLAPFLKNLIELAPKYVAQS